MSSQQSSPPENGDTVQIKLLVGSAAEAVKTIKQKFGDNAKVLSVKQVEAEGLRRLIQKPRLEVVVQATRASIISADTIEKIENPSPPVEVSPGDSSEKNSGDLISKPAEEPQLESETKDSPIANVYAKSDRSSRGYFEGIDGQTESEEVPTSAGPLGSAANPVKRGTLEVVKRAVSMLKALGLEDSLIERIRYELDFQNLGKMPAVDLYSRICDWLHKQVPDTREENLGIRRAFIGTSGSGKTSALCKSLSAEVFINKRSPSVLKIDSSLPNPSDGLEAFCEIVGSPMCRSFEELGEISEQRPLFIDTPGLDLDNQGSIDLLKAQLDALETTERILVLNAAYEAEVILESMAVGERIGATHLVFTHLDETRRVGKLWKYVLSDRVKPLFLSHGPNPAGDYTVDCFSYLLQRTFPHGSLLPEAATENEGLTESAKREEELAEL